MTVRYKTISQFSSESGYSKDAIRGKIRDGIWLEGRVWRRAPDGHILIDIEGYNEWVVNGNGLACSPSVKHPKRSTSRLAGTAAGASSSSPPPLT